MSMSEILAQFAADTKMQFEGLADTLSTFAKQVRHEVENARPRSIAAREDDPNRGLDEALFDSAPVVAVPKHAEFAALEEVGHRFLLSADGLFIEIRRPWLHAIQQLQALPANGPKPPYGSVPEKIELAFGRLGAALPLIQGFVAEARTAMPNEHAAWIVWDNDAKQLKYKAVETTSSSARHVDIKRPALEAHESLAIDLHSHASLGAFFSEQDDIDDAGEVKISGVIGSLDGEPSVAFRLCLLGRTVQLKVPASAVFAPVESE